MQRVLPAILVTVLLATDAVQCAVTCAADRIDPRPRAIRRSDVVFMYDNPKMYDAYGCTVLGWAGWSRSKEHIEQAHAAGVRQFTVSVGWLTEFRGMIDFSDNFLDAAARNYAGETFVVPWLWDHKHKGQPAWWWCTNSPLYRQFLEARLALRMPLLPDGLHIDDYRGSSGAVTWRSACFCRHCMAAFREYLADEISKKKLAELGIDTLDGFDYRQYLIGKGVAPADYNNRRRSLPLADEFYDFHVRANTAYVRKYREKAEQIRGEPLTLCVNSGVNSPQALAIASELSYFCCEVHHEAHTLAPTKHPITVYKLGDGLNRPITSTASGQDWAYVYENEKPCLVRSWTALSYAFGHNLMAPHRQWCYTKEKGTHWYPGPEEEYAWLYKFVRKQARLLDDYNAIAPVAVVYDNAANKQNRGKIEPLCIALAERNIPFTVVIAGDNWVDYRITAEQLAPYEAVITACNTDWIDAPQKQVLAAVEAQGRLIAWPNDQRLAELIGKPIAIDHSEHVMAVARAKANDKQAPVVVHLLNRQYDGEADTIVEQSHFVVKLSNSIFEGRQVSKAVMHSPRVEPKELAIKKVGNMTEIRVDRLGLWGIVELAL